MHYLTDVALFLAVVLMFVLAGTAVVPRLTEKTAFEGVLAGFGLILGGCEVLTWFIGSLGALSFPLILAILALLVAAVAYKNQSFGANVQKLKQGLGSLKTLRGWDLACTVYVAAIFGLTFVLTLAPPNGSDYDSLVYHLTVPQQYLRAGHIIELSYDHHSYFALGTEMLYTLGLWLHGPVLAKLFHWLMLPLSCFTLIAIGHRHLSLRAGLFAAALFASIPVVQFEASTAYIDLALTAFSLLAFMSFFAWLETRSQRALLGCALFCGICLGTKYLGVLTFGWLGLATLMTMAREKQIQIVPLLKFALIALLVGGGYYLRNFFWVGNPVYPFAYEIFGGSGWTAEMAKAYTADQKNYGMGHSLVDLIWLPWRLSMTPLNVASMNGRIVGLGFWPFNTSVVEGSSGAFEAAGLIFQSILGPALFAFTAPVIFMKNKPGVVKFALGSMLFFFAFWALTGQYLRYLIPAFAILCLAAGWGIDSYLKRSAPLRYTTGIALVVWAVFTPYFVLQGSASTLPVVLGQQTPEEYLTRSFGGYDAMHWAATKTPPVSYFAVFGEPRCYYLERRYFLADDMHNNIIDYKAIHSAGDMVEALHRRKVTYFLWNSDLERNGGAGNAPPYLQEALSAGMVSLAYEKRGYQIYRLEPKKAAR